MSHAYARNHVHILFATKGVKKCIHGDTRMQLWTNLQDTFRQYGATVVAVGGTEDHVHILVTVPPRVALAALLCAAKANSSTWMNEQGHFFAWQAGYGAFSVSSSNLDKVKAFIENQAQSHRKTSFETEFAALLKKHEVDFTPKKNLA